MGQILLSSFLSKETGLQRFICLIPGQIAYRCLRPKPRFSGSKSWTFSMPHSCITCPFNLQKTQLTLVIYNFHRESTFYYLCINLKIFHKMSSSGKGLLNKSVHFHIEAESPTKNCSLLYSSLLFLCPTLNQ